MDDVFFSSDVVPCFDADYRITFCDIFVRLGLQYIFAALSHDGGKHFLVICIHKLAAIFIGACIDPGRQD